MEYPVATAEQVERAEAMRRVIEAEIPPATDDFRRRYWNGLVRTKILPVTPETRARVSLEKLRRAYEPIIEARAEALDAYQVAAAQAGRTPARFDITRPETTLEALAEATEAMRAPADTEPVIVAVRRADSEFVAVLADLGIRVETVERYAEIWDLPERPIGTLIEDELDEWLELETGSVSLATVRRQAREVVERAKTVSNWRPTDQEVRTVRGALLHEAVNRALTAKPHTPRRPGATVANGRGRHR